MSNRITQWFESGWERHKIKGLHKPSKRHMKSTRKVAGESREQRLGETGNGITADLRAASARQPCPHR